MKNLSNSYIKPTSKKTIKLPLKSKPDSDTLVPSTVILIKDLKNET